MSETAVHSTGHAAAHEGDHGGAHGDLVYVKVAIILGLFTAVEVLTYFVDFGPAAVGVLLGLMVVKFALVGLYFMHLKFDNKIFMQMFIAGLAFAVVVYCIMLTAFHFW